MPGLVRGMARTAAVVGTATAVSNRVSRRQAGRWAAQDAQQQQAAQPVYYEQPPVQQVVAAPPDKIAQLKELGELRDSGVLTQAEFAAEKERILGS